VEAFEIIEHPQLLSEPEADARTLIRQALEQFLARHSVAGCDVCVSVPGQSSFTRFVKLPPVEPKKVPDIVRFEAEQQIPFPIDDVIWRWQAFEDPDSPDVEVGIFAIKRADLNETLRHFDNVGLNVHLVQMAPLALYNFLLFDEQRAPEGATLLVDIGADKTDLVVADGPRIWTRTIQIGGNNFTEALVKAFKLSFAKAEKLKRTAASSKYARQIYQAMRPVFADLVQEIQRSVGYYTSLHRDTRFTRLVGLGNGFRMPGLQKFLEQNLNISVARVDTFNNLHTTGSVNAPQFTENALSFAVAYGLGAQGLGSAAVSTNLLPEQILRARLWAKKRFWFGAAAALLLLALAMYPFRAYADRDAVGERTPELQQSQRIVSRIRQLQRELDQVKGQGQGELNQIRDVLQLFHYRGYWASVQDVVSEAISRRARDQQLLGRYAQATSLQARQGVLEQIRQIPRSQRQMIFVEQFTPRYVEDLTARARDAAETEDPQGTQYQADDAATAVRGFRVDITGRTPLGRSEAVNMLAAVLRDCRELSTQTGGRFRVRSFSGPSFPASDTGDRDTVEDGRQVAQIPDPMFPDDPEEDIAKDTRFTISLTISIEDPQAGDAEDAERRR
jgi:type IV pilus assembly protein PilM